MTVGLKIWNEDTGTQVLGPAIASIVDEDTLIKNLDLPPGIFGLHAPIVRAVHTTAIAYDDDRIVTLKPATYRLEIMAFAGEDGAAKTKRFVVTADYIGSYWAD